MANGAALKLNGVSYTTAEALSINGTGISGGGALVNTGTSTFAGAVTAATSATINAGGGTLTFTGGLVKNGTVLTLTGGGTVNVNTTGISGASANSDLVVDGTAVNLNVASSYNGPTFVYGGGTLQNGIANALPTDTVLTLGEATNNTAGTYKLNGYNQSIAGLNNAGSGSATVSNGGGTDSTLTLTGTSSFGGQIQNGGGVGTLALTVNASGKTVALSGANTYTGNTSIVAGVIELTGSGSISGSPVIDVQSGATLKVYNGYTIQSGQTLKGRGTVQGGLIMASGATLAPGSSPGTISIDALTLSDATISSFELNPTDQTVGSDINDLVVVIGNFTLDGLLNVTSATLGDFSLVTSGTWRLFNYSGELTNNGMTLNSMPALASGKSWQLDTTTAGQINLTVIPEPGTAGIVATFLAAALLRRRRY